MWNKLRKYFVSGLVVFAPIAITVYLFSLVINMVEGFFSKIVEPYFYESFGFYFYGLSIIVGVYLVILIGFLVTNILGKKVYEFFENLIIRLPFFKQVYPALKEMAMFLFSRDRLNSQFKKVVIVEYPKKDVHSFGFLTNDAAAHISEKTKKDLCNVFIPSSPSPLTGFVVMIPRKDILIVDITVEEAFKFIMSGGVVNPH